MIKLKVFDQNIAEVNSYLLIKQKDAIVIDPGFNGDQINDFCQLNDISIKDVLLTHGHFDHIKGIEKLAKNHQFKIHVSEADAKMLSDENMNYAKAFGQTFRKPDNIEVIVLLNDKIEILGEKLTIFFTPGHTKGSICILHENKLFSGDTLFSDSIGRTDLVTGSSIDIKRSLELLKKVVSNKVMVYPGHGKSSEMKKIKEENYYLK